jgi:methionyl-tRNA synthetase
LHVDSVKDLVANENLLSFVVYDKFRHCAGAVGSNPTVKAWFDQMTTSYAEEIDQFIAKNSGALVDLTQAKKKPTGKDPKADKKQAAKDKAAAKKSECAAKPKIAKKVVQEIPQEYKDLVNSQKLKRSNKGQEILPVADKKNVLITSALPYVNNVPHLGNLIGAVLSADTFARFSRLRGWNTIYMCGTDEYGTATEYKARLEKKTPKEICDHYNKIHTQIYEDFDLDFDLFLRTTTEKHKKIAQDIFLKIHARGFLKPKKMMASVCDHCDLALADRFIKGTCPKCKSENAKGDQCDDCQALMTPEDLIDPKCNLCGTQPTKKETEHFFLNLTDLQPDLTAWIEKASVDGAWTNNSIAISKSWLKGGLEERCVTRDLKWGVPVPIEGFENKVFYVWFDAPIGYISITANYTDHWEKWWKNPDNVKLYQFMGKDNVPFHTVVFPSSLIASGEKWTMLHHISTTEYLQYEDTKFSKTNGTGVFGDDVQKTTIAIDVWRYYLLVNRPEASDSTFSWDDVQVKNNNELIQNPGNLTNRVLKFIYKNKDKKVPTATWDQLSLTDKKFVGELMAQFNTYVETFEAVKIKDS